MKKKILLFLVLMFVAVIGSVALHLKGQFAQNPNIHVTAPRASQEVHSPLTVKGEAVGNWYFEASFPVKLFDANGMLLVAVPAQAKGDWMTTNFVPFEAILTFNTPTTQTGTLVFQKDNPSGLPEHDASIRIPVVFSK